MWLIDIRFWLFELFYAIIRFCITIFGWIQNEFLTIIKDLPFYALFGQDADNVLSGQIDIPDLFVRFLITSIVLLLIFFLTKAILNKRKEQGESNWSLWINSLKHVFFIFFFVGALCLFMWVVRYFTELIYDNQTHSIDKEIFRALRPAGIDVRTWDEIARDGYDIEYDHYQQMESGTTFIITGILGAVVPMFLLSFSIISIISKIFQLLYLFILSPWLSAFAVVDNGKMTKKWKTMFSSNLISILLYPITIEVYVLFLSRTMSFWDTRDTDGILVHSIVKIILIIAATLSINSAGMINAAFFGNNISAAEGIRQISQIQQLGAAAKSAGLLAAGTLGHGLAAMKLGAKGIGTATRGVKALANNSGNIASGIGSAFSNFNAIKNNINGNKHMSFGMKSKLFKESGSRLLGDIKQTFNTPIQDANAKFQNRFDTRAKLLDKFNQMKQNLKG